MPWRCADHRDQMREQQILRAGRLRHGTEIGGRGLSVEERRWHAAVTLRTHHRVYGRMYDHVDAPSQGLNLSGGRRGTRRREGIVAGIAPDNHASGRRVDAVGGVARDVG
jgi:hypothetical protein